MPILVLIWSLLFCGIALADGSPDVSSEARWSTLGMGGGTAAMMRVGKGFEKSAPADYLICNDTEYTCTQSSCDQFQKSLVIDTAALGPGVVRISPARDGTGPKCGCIYGAPNILFRGPQDFVIQGTYKAFAWGSFCKDHALPVSSGKPVSANCAEIKEVPGLPGRYADWQCTVWSQVGNGKRNVRLCAQGKESFISDEGKTFGDHFFAIVDQKLVTENINNSAGQSRNEFSQVTYGCADFYDIDELVVVIDHENGPNAKAVRFENANIFFIGE